MTERNLSPIRPQAEPVICPVCSGQVDSKVLYAVADGHGGHFLERLHPDCVAEEAPQ